MNIDIVLLLTLCAAFLITGIGIGYALAKAQEPEWWGRGY